MSVLTIYNTEIHPGEGKTLHLEMAELPTHTPMHLPVYVQRAEAPGPTLLITASIHGDEVNGTETIRRMIREAALTPVAGTVIAMPIINVYGFLGQSRDLPDGKDLNRSFPGSKSGSLARRMAHVLLQEVVQHCDFGIDLHTGGARRTNYPQVRCAFDRAESLALGKAFGAPFLMNSGEIPGSFRKAASNLGKSIIVFEGGESQRFDEMAIEEAMHGIHRVMGYLEMCDCALPAHDSRILEKSRWIRARTAGMMRLEVSPGDLVEKGQLLAVIGDPYGAVEQPIKSPARGYVIGLNNHPVVHAGDAVLHIGIEAT